MSRNNRPNAAAGFALPEALVARRVAFAGSGASGVHEDQKSRVHRTGSTNRVGSRSARTRAAILNDGY